MGTVIEHGGFPIKYKDDGSGDVEIASKKRERREFNGREYILEESITGDFALVKAWKADTRGNLVFRRTALNFNADMAKAGRVCVAEVEEIVEAGELDPDEIHVSGVYVDRLVLGPSYEKRIEFVTEDTGGGAINITGTRERIVRRVAREFQDGMCVHGHSLSAIILRTHARTHA